MQSTEPFSLYTVHRTCASSVLVVLCALPAFTYRYLTQLVQYRRTYDSFVFSEILGSGWVCLTSLLNFSTAKHTTSNLLLIVACTGLDVK